MEWRIHSLPLCLHSRFLSAPLAFGRLSMFARFVFAVPLSDLLFDFFGDQVNGIIKIRFVIFGVEVRPVRIVLRDENRIGLLVMEITPGEPASMASLMIGDILVGVDRVLFRSVNDLEIALQGTGERILNLLFLRGDRRNIRRVAIRLGMARRVAA